MTPLPAGIPSEARGSSERAHPEQKEEARPARAASREQQGASSGCSPAASRGWLGGCDFAIAGGMQEGRECGNVERVDRVEWKQDRARVRVQMQRGPRQSVSRLLSPFSVFRSAFLWFLLLGSRPSFFGSRIPPHPRLLVPASFPVPAVVRCLALSCACASLGSFASTPARFPARLTLDSTVASRANIARRCSIVWFALPLPCPPTANCASTTARHGPETALGAVRFLICLVFSLSLAAARPNIPRTTQPTDRHSQTQTDEN